MSHSAERVDIDWIDYDRLFSEIKTRHQPLGDEERNHLATLFGELLGYSTSTEPWGIAGGFGNETEVVIQLQEPPPHRSNTVSFGLSERQQALRIFRAQKGGRTYLFQQERIASGRPVNDESTCHFQRVFDVGEHQGFQYVIHEWVEGPTLEWCHRNLWATNPLNGSVVQGFLHDLVVGIVLSSWREATATSGVLWDLRDANFVVEPTHDGERLVLVDTGNLRHLLQQRNNREGQINTAIKRLRTMSERLLASQGRWPEQQRSWKRNFTRVWEESLLGDAFIGFANQQVEESEVFRAYEGLIEGMKEEGLFRENG